jgi:hypothetical protein
VPYYARYELEEFPPTIQHLVTARLETVVTIGFLALRMKDVDGLRTFGNGWADIAPEPDVDKLPSYLNTSTWVAGQHLYWLSFFALSSAAHAHEGATPLAALKSLSQKHPEDEYLAHDVTLLESCVGGPCIDPCSGTCTSALCCGGDVSTDLHGIVDTYLD